MVNDMKFVKFDIPGHSIWKIFSFSFILFRYPKQLLDFEYDPTFAIRGLHFDCKKSVLMKIDFVHNVNLDTCFLGRNKLKPAEICKIYPGLHVSMIFVNFQRIVLLITKTQNICILYFSIFHFLFSS
jgi:hypothetical protein